MTKPNERLVNPQSVGLPTLAFERYAAFREAIAMPENLVRSCLPVLSDPRCVIRSAISW